MNQAPAACAAGLICGTLLVTACSGGPASSKPSALSCASQLAAWENTGVRANLGDLPSQLDKTGADVTQESLDAGTAGTSAAKSDLGTLVKESKLLTARQPPSCVPNLRADYATFLRFYGYLVDQELPAFIANPRDRVAGLLAPGHATEAKQALAQVHKDLSGYPG